MTGLDLRPLSLGEILDRTFNLYRRHFLLFIGIAAIPNLFRLAIALGSLRLLQGSVGSSGPFGLAAAIFSPSMILFSLLSLLVTIFVYLLTQGGTIHAVSELYLGRSTTIAVSLRSSWAMIGTLFGVALLNGLAILGATLLFVIPGIYVACRLLVCIPTAVIEKRGPGESVSRSWNLTKDFASRAFVIYLVYLAISFGVGALIGGPVGLFIGTARRDPSALQGLQAVLQVVTTGVNVLLSPILLIATSVFYYDLRVRKEAFDLQFMMNPHGDHLPGGNTPFNSITS